MSEYKLQKAFISWIGGKNSALALHYVLSQKLFDVKFLFTTINEI